MTKRFRLALVNAAEDVPRVIRAYGRACGGEFALVLRPTERRGVLVHQTRTASHVWRSSDGRDAPARPDVSTPSEEAVAEVKAARSQAGRQGPITLRGQWSGYLYCDDEVPVVELRRKLATYAVLTVASRPSDGVWAWKVERLERWFGGPGQDTGEATSLLHAIEAGLASAMGLLGQVCGHRDSRRRGAYDASWAEKHPVRAAKERKDPTERLKPKKPRRRKKRATATATARSASEGATERRKSEKATAPKRKATSSTASRRRKTTASAKPPASKRSRTRPKATPPKKAPAKTTARRSAQASVALDDAAADKALLDAFKDAVSSALSEVP